MAATETVLPVRVTVPALRPGLPAAYVPPEVVIVPPTVMVPLAFMLTEPPLALLPPVVVIGRTRSSCRRPR